VLLFFFLFVQKLDPIQRKEAEAIWAKASIRGRALMAVAVKPPLDRLGRELTEREVDRWRRALEALSPADRKAAEWAWDRADLGWVSTKVRHRALLRRIERP
jgi:hypothetical protein